MAFMPYFPDNSMEKRMRATKRGPGRFASVAGGVESRGASRASIAGNFPCCNGKTAVAPVTAKGTAEIDVRFARFGIMI